MGEPRRLMLPSFQGAWFRPGHGLEVL